MWLGGQQKQPADNGESQTGIVTMGGGEPAVMLDCERRSLPVYGPGGYTWSPKVGQRVLVIQGPGEIPCVVGARQGGDRPDQVTVEGRQTTVRGNSVNISAGDGVRIDSQEINLMGQVLIEGQALEGLIAQIVKQIVGIV